MRPDTATVGDLADPLAKGWRRAMKCELCGTAAECHVTNVDTSDPEGDRYTEQHLCLACAHKLVPNYPIPVPKHLVPQLRELVAFIKCKNRMPTAAELPVWGGAGDLPGPEPGTKAFADQVAYLETLAGFIEQHDRFPSEGELPDPWSAGQVGS
jgi:hypothetical protein